MPKMRVMQVARKDGPIELVERDIPEPGAHAVRIKVEACGICHSDSYAKAGTFPGIAYPRVPGHEVAGVVDAVGAGVSGWKKGDRAGVGWYAGHCGYCGACRRGDFILCETSRQISGITRDGGYAEYMIASAAALARVPSDLPAAEAAPLLCAGVTTYNALRHGNAVAGDLVAILGIGGLGHLAVQYAAKMGFETAAIARGKDKEALAKKLGAQHYIDSQAQDPAAALGQLGGAKVILATVTSGKAMSAVLTGLRSNGQMIIVGAADVPLEIPAVALIRQRLSIQGWPSGIAADSQDTMAFSVQAGIRPMIETYPLERAAEAYERMMSGQARFRVVLKTGR